MKSSLIARRRISLVVLLLMTASCTSLQSIPNSLQALAGDPNSLLNILNDQPISTSFADTDQKPISPDKFTQSDFKSLLTLPRGPNGGFLLQPGAYELKVKSYCLQAGTYGPSKGNGYLYAPMKGSRAKIIRSILKSAAAHPEIQQTQIQSLIWAVESKAKIYQLSPELLRAASILLTKEEIYDLNGGALGLIPDQIWDMALSRIPPELRRIYEIHSEIRRKLTEAHSNFAELERIAVLTGIPPQSGISVPDNSWSTHPGGFFVRYIPEGYSSTTIQLIVPEKRVAFNNETSLKLANFDLSKTDAGTLGISQKNIKFLAATSSISYEYDPSEDIAVPANTSSQRLGFQPEPDPDHKHRPVPNPDQEQRAESESEHDQEETIDDPCKRPNASVIGCENQSLGESINITGTPFALHYQSDRASGRYRVNRVAVDYAQGLGGWTLSAHHRYDPVANALYLGYGDRRDRTALGAIKPQPDGSFLIASEGATVVYEFASDGRHLKTVHGLTGGTLQTFSYDTQGRLIKVSDSNGNHTVIQRASNGQPTAIISPYGQRTLLAVDTNGYLARITHPSGKVESFTTTAKGLLSTYTNARQQTSKFTYDDKGRLIRDTDAAGGAQSLTRSEAASGFTVTLRTAEGRTFQYQTMGGGSGDKTRIITDATGLKTKLTQTADGSRTTELADGSQITQTVEPDPRFGQAAAITKQSSIKMPSGFELSSTSGRTVTLADPANPFSLSELTETFSVNGRTYSSTYNGSNRSIVNKTPLGRTWKATIDKQGRAVSQEAAGLLPIAYSYDAHGRLSTVMQGNGIDARTVKFSYGSAGHLERITDPLGRTQSYRYDADGRITQQTLPDDRVIKYSYDANGNMIAITPPERPEHKFDYTPVNLTSKYAPPAVEHTKPETQNTVNQDKHLTRITLDADKNVTSITPSGRSNSALDYALEATESQQAPSATGHTAYQTQYTYNLDKQLTRITRPDGKSVNFIYDTGGRLSGLATPTSNINYAYTATGGKLSTIIAPDATLSYAYDGDLLLSEAWEGAIAGKVTRSYHNDFKLNSLSLNGNKIEYAYDDDGLLVRAGDLKLTRNADNGMLTGTTLGGTTTSLSYNAFGELGQLNAGQTNDTLLDIQYTRDKAGRITQQTETIAGQTTTTNYSYDLAGRLVKVEKSGASIAYRYDSNGNRLSRNNITGAYDAQDRLLTYGNASYRYTASGELKTRISDGQTTAYTYDVRGNLTGVILPDGTTIEYLVDGRNRRIGKKRNGAKAQGFLYQSQLRPAAELDGNGNIVSRFVYATRINVPDYMIKGGATYRIVTDHLGSPRLVVNTATGQIAQRMDFDEFGNVLADSNPGFQPFGFAGGLYDQDTKLVRFGARDYDTDIGRWTAKDPIGFAGGDSNLYGYTINNPLNFIDPTGLEGFIIGAQGGGVVGFVMGAGVEGAAGVYIGTEGIYTYLTLGGGFAVGMGGGVSISGGYVRDLDNFWGYGNEYGVNTSIGGAAVCQSNPDANTWGRGPLVSAQLSLGPSIGGDLHVLKTHTWKGPGFSWSELGLWLETGIRQIYGIPISY